MTLDFLFLCWIEPLIESHFIYAHHADDARPYFEEGLEPWEYENLCEDDYVRRTSYG